MLIKILGSEVWVDLDVIEINGVKYKRMENE